MKKSAQHIGRRRFLKAVPAAVAAGVTLPAVTSAVASTLPPAALGARQGRGGAPPRFGKEVLKCAEQVAGLEFTDAEEEAIVRQVSGNLTSYEQLRKIDIPLDTEPAFTFRPYLPGKQPAGHSTRNAKLPIAKPARITVSSALEDLAFEPIPVLASLIEGRKITSTDLSKMYLARLKRYGDPLHCVVTLTEDLALAQAANADKDLKAGRYRGPLHGLPWGAKDLFDTKGIRTTWGAKPFENRVADVDATIVERLRDAGAVLCAKLSMGSLAQGGVWFGGSTRNPWAPDLSSSGSSAGPGAATSAGLVAFAVGTETRGSIISPSSTCGVVGLRPTYGRVSRYGAMALSWTMDKIGPMCRRVEDCAIVFNAIYGADGRDETVVDAPFNWNPDVPLSSVKIGYVAREFEPAPSNPAADAGRGGADAGRGGGGGRGGGLTPEEARKRAEERLTLLKDALEVMRAAGAKLEPIELPEFQASTLNFILSAEGAAAFDDATRDRRLDQMNANGTTFGSSWPNTFRTHRFVPAVEYIRAQRARTLLMRQMDALMSKYDVFLSSTSSASLAITNLTGHPALCLKSGFVADQPQALMITGRLYDEATLLRVALAYERATKWHTMNPALDENLKKMKPSTGGQESRVGQAGDGEFGEDMTAYDI